MSRKETNDQRKIRKAFIKKLIKEGDKRSFAEIDADIELQNWTDRFHPRPLEQLKEEKDAA